MTKDDWKFVEGRLKNFYHSVDILCDGYMLTLKLETKDQFHNEIMTYVNGGFKGKWLLDNGEERRRFFCEHRKYLYNNKERATCKKLEQKFGRKYLAVQGIDYNKQYLWYSPSWTSFKELKKHLLKNNHEIRLIKAGEKDNKSVEEAVVSIPRDEVPREEASREEALDEAQVCTN